MRLDWRVSVSCLTTADAGVQEWHQSLWRLRETLAEDENWGAGEEQNGRSGVDLFKYITFPTEPGNLWHGGVLCSNKPAVEVFVLNMPSPSGSYVFICFLAG